MVSQENGLVLTQVLNTGVRWGYMKKGWCPEELSWCFKAESWC